MSKFVLNIDKPQGVGGEPTTQLVFIGDGGSPETFTLTVNPAVDPAYPSLSSAIIAGSGKISVTGAASNPGGANTQLQFNNAGAFGGVAGVTSDGTKITIAPGDLLVTNISDAAGVVLVFQDNTNHNWGYGQGAFAAITTGIENTAFGGLALNALTTGNDNATLGFGAGFKLTTGGQDTFIGTFAGINITTGSDNVAIGFQCMQGAAASGPAQNVAVGSQAGNALSTGQNNTIVGWHAANSMTTGSDNVCVGQQAGQHITTGGSNVLIGELAGATSVTTGTGNVFIGKAAGQNESGSNKLYIANSNTATPLIQGDFSAASITINGTFTATGLITFAAGTTAQASYNTTTGVLKTTPLQGDHEFDGVISYITNETTSGRGSIPVEQHFKLTANGGTISTIANFFGATSNISLVSGGFYEIEIDLWFLNTTAGTVTFTLTNSAAPTSQNVHYEESPITGLVAPPGTATYLVGDVFNDATAGFTVTTGTLTDAANHHVRFRIILQNGTGTSLKIQATKNVGGTITPGRGSRWYCKRLSSANVGNFAA